MTGDFRHGASLNTTEIPVSIKFAWAEGTSGQLGCMFVLGTWLGGTVGFCSVNIILPGWCVPKVWGLTWREFCHSCTCIHPEEPTIAHRGIRISRDSRLFQILVFDSKRPFATYQSWNMWSVRIPNHSQWQFAVGVPHIWNMCADGYQFVCPRVLNRFLGHEGN